MEIFIYFCAENLADYSSKKNTNMKKLVLLTLCVTGLLSCTQKRPSVIERPVFDVRNTSMIEIDKIEMSDSATIFHIDAFSMPGSWVAIDVNTFIRESGSDEKLVVTKTEGIEISERMTIPESGTVSFQLFFPPLKSGVKKIDFLEDIEQGGWKIMGIHLLPNAKVRIEPVPNDVINTKTASLPLPVYNLESAQVSGRIFGYVKGIGSGNITVFIPNAITGETNQVEIPVSDDGSFSGEIVPGMAGIFNSSVGNLFIVPGQEIKIYSDLKKRNRFESRYRMDKEPGDSINTYISGYFTADELNIISQATRGMIDYQKLMNETVNMKPEEFKRHILSLMNSQIDDLKQRNYSPSTQTMAENSIKLSAFSFLMQYESFISAAYMQVNNIKSEDRSKITFKPEKPGDDYYSFLKGQIADNMAFLSGFRSLATSLSNVFSLPDGNDQPAKERFAYFKEKAALVLGADKGILFDLVQLKIYGSQLNDLKSYTDAEKQELREVFKHNPVYAQALITESDKLETLLAANKENKESILNDLPQVSQEKLLDAIVANYRGKVVLVDFWATWCGPCMVAMKSILPMKEEMKGKDLVFLYLTGETSPLGDFTKTYPTITGEHYRMSAAQWKYMCDTYNIPGIPTYMVYDRQAKLIDRFLGFPGVDKIREAIEKGL